MSFPPCNQRKVAIIGSGLGGLSSAVQLAHAGYKVTVFEKNENPGGRMASLEDSGFTWDTGTWPLAQPEVLQELWKSLGRKLEDYLTLVRLPLACRYFWEDGTRIDDNDEFRKRADVVRYLHYGQGAHSIEEPFVKWAENWWEYLNPAHLACFRHLPKLFSFRSLHATTSRFFKDPHLVQLFDHYATRTGSSPYSAPGILSALAYLEAKHGCWHVVGGTHQIIQALLRVAREQGVEIQTECEITGVYDSSIAIAGKWQAFDATICNQDVLMAYQSLLPRRRCGEFRDAFLNRYRTSLSCYFLHLGIDRAYPELAHRNVLFTSNQEQEYRQLMAERMPADDPTMELIVSSRSDPSLAPSGCENWTIRIATPPIRSSIQWEDLGEPIANRLIERLETRFGFTDLSKHVVKRTFLTPAELRKRFQGFGGCQQGFASHSLRQTLIGPSVEPPGMTGFFFAGASMRPSGGIAQVLQNAHTATIHAIHHLKGLPEEPPASQ